MLVYKYLHLDRIDVLKGGLIRFTQSAALNDPFESTPIGTKLFESLVEHQKHILAKAGGYLSELDRMEVQYHINRNARKSVDQIVNKTRYNKGILSLSLNRSELLMWSHYCDSHRGFVIGFNGLHSYFQKGIPDKRGGLREVIYSESRPLLPSFDEFSANNVAEVLLYFKSQHWRYENELRMLHNVKYADVKPGNDVNGNPIYLFSFPVESVEEVILGCQMPQLLRQEITNLVREKYQDAKIYQAEMSKTDFDLELIEV